MNEMELLGTRVVRGPDWKWENQDGGEGSVGTVVQIGQEKKSPVTAPIVWVQWDAGNKANYRAEVNGQHDLRVLDSTNGGTSLTRTGKRPQIGVCRMLGNKE